MPPTTSKNVVLIEYADLVEPSTATLLQAIHDAFSYDGYGIIAVRGVPGLREKRNSCLPLAHVFANLPAEVQRQYEHAASRSVSLINKPIERTAYDARMARNRRRTHHRWHMWDSHANHMQLSVFIHASFCR